MATAGTDAAAGVPLERTWEQVSKSQTALKRSNSSRQFAPVVVDEIVLLRQTRRRSHPSGGYRMSIRDHPVWIIGGALVAAAALWLGPTDIQRRVCSTDLVFGSGAGDFACKEEFQAVPIDEATATVDSFLGRASGARPQEAWDMLSAAVQARFPAADFETDWDKFLWAERTGDIESQENRNTWLVTFRTYAGKANESASGDVDTMTIPIELTRQGNGRILITDMSLPNRIDAERRRYKAITPAILAKTYNRPTESSRVAALVLTA